MNRVVHRFLTVALVASGAVLWEGTLAQGQTPNGGFDPRRTPAVEIFRRYKDSVICVTGPAIYGRGQLKLVEEFFAGRRNREVTSLGSGFVIHESGYILSNVHTVEKVIAHSVTLRDGKMYPADLLALDRRHDLALLKIDAGRPLPVVKFARGGDLMIGEPVIVIGNPFGLPLTCTTGVVSAVGRATQPDGLPGVTLHDMLQTDASINVGSSGGPWFNALGDVIGITAVKRMNSDNIAFGVPVAAIRSCLPEMLDVERRDGITTGLALSAMEPAQVAAVEAGSPAAVAGVLPGDLLERLDEKPILGRLEFCLALIGHKPHDAVKLDLLRDRKPAEVTLTLRARPRPDGAALLKASYGLTAVPLDEAKAQAASLRVRRGVVIAEVAKGPPWNYDKLQAPPVAGDVLARINSIRPHDLGDVGLILDRIQPGQTVNMVLLRRNGEMMTRVDLSIIVPPRARQP
jgi:S1-C subfamily serine protease